MRDLYLAHYGIKGQKWGVRNGPPYPLDRISNGNAVLLKDYDGPAYFVSEQKMSTKTLMPRVPSNFLTKNGYEDNETPRVSFAPSIDKCLAGLSQNLDDKTFYCYKPKDISKCLVYNPNEKAVPDSSITDELWITNPVEIVLDKTIHITGNTGSDGKTYKYGKNEATLYDDWTYDILDDSLSHYGVKGMKWGVRRYQNADGSLTEEGVYHYRKLNAAKTKKSVDRIYNSMSKQDKKLMGDDKNSKEFLTYEEGEYVVKRFLDKDGNIPVAWLDIMTTYRPGHLTVAIGTDPKYRGQGRAQKLAQKGVNWFDKNADRLDANYLGWGAYSKNTGSRRIAEKVGFEYEPEKSTEDWSVYGYRPKK